MTKPASTFILNRSALVDTDGNPTWAATKQFTLWDVQLQNGLDQIGNFIGNLKPSVQIVGKPGTVGTITQNLDAAGQVTADGVDFSRAYLNKDTDHIADGTGSPLAGGKVAYLALVANPPVANGLLEWDGTAWHWIQRPQNFTAAAHKFVKSFTQTTGAFADAQADFTDISGQATAAQVPNLDLLNGQITTGQLPASGLTATITTAKLTTLGANGSMTFTNGILTAQTPAT